MDLLQVQDELNIILQITRKQEEVVTELRQYLQTANVDGSLSPGAGQDPSFDSMFRSEDQAVGSNQFNLYEPLRVPRGPEMNRTVAGHPRSFAFLPSNPINEVLDHLHRELDDLSELRDNSNELVNRTVQLVNIRLEDHGHAILVFTVITIIY